MFWSISKWLFNQGYQGIPVAQTEECCTSNTAMGSIPSECISGLKCITWKVPACQMHKCKYTVYHRPKKKKHLQKSIWLVHYIPSLLKSYYSFMWGGSCFIDKCYLCLFKMAFKFLNAIFFFFAIGTCVSNKGWKNANANEIWELRQIRTTKPPFIANLAHLLIFKFGTSRQVVECLTITTPDVIGFYVLQPVVVENGRTVR